MVEPIWQYVTLVVLFALGALLNILSLGLMKLLEASGSNLSALTEKEKRVTAGSLVYRTFAAGFGMYLSYCLFMWNSDALGTIIIAAHWSSVIAMYIHSLINNGKDKVYTYGMHIFGLLYSAGMLVALTMYGIKFL